MWLYQVAPGKMTYEMPGVDLGELVRSWQESSAVSPVSASESEPALDRGERLRAYEQQKAEAVPEPASEQLARSGSRVRLV